LIKLYCDSNSEIKNVSFMKELKVLSINAGDHDSINQKSMIGLNLTELYCDYNTAITDLSFMKSLQILHVCGSNSKIDQSSINHLSLIELKCNDNSKIYNVSFMKSLERLNATGDSGITKKGIRGLKLKKIDFYGNTRLDISSDTKSLVTTLRLFYSSPKTYIYNNRHDIYFSIVCAIGGVTIGVITSSYTKYIPNFNSSISSIQSIIKNYCLSFF
jgi:hypothetical protein